MGTESRNGIFCAERETHTRETTALLSSGSRGAGAGTRDTRASGAPLHCVPCPEAPGPRAHLTGQDRALWQKSRASLRGGRSRPHPPGSGSGSALPRRTARARGRSAALLAAPSLAPGTRGLAARPSPGPPAARRPPTLKKAPRPAWRPTRRPDPQQDGVTGDGVRGHGAGHPERARRPGAQAGPACPPDSVGGR